MNYFTFFDIPEAFEIDQKLLKRKFLEKSRAYHPDFFSQEDEASQEEALRLSSINNEAYKVLSNQELRIKYILTEHAVLAPEGQNTVPQDFLMEVMDINEAIMDLQMEENDKALENVKNQISDFKTSLLDQSQSFMLAFDSGDKSAKVLEGIKEYYLKHRYLVRMEENLKKLD
ncbi:MAG: iron-sulfur cluster co-chaperone HscB C-terminal domain-containing protein [Saprospiraceae bacterium]